MAYTKTLWKTGDIVTQEKMNKIEQGIKSMELPAVTTNDNGKSLVVENGTWALGNASGGGLKRVKDDPSDNGGVIEGYVEAPEGATDAPNSATGWDAHAEGISTKATGFASHAEGRLNVSSGFFAHAEGLSNTASGYSSHAEGYLTRSIGENTHTEGTGTIATKENQHVQGRYNEEDFDSYYADIVGNGTSDSNRSNAYTLDWFGNGTFAGKVTVGTQPTNANDLTTKQYVDNAIGGANVGTGNFIIPFHGIYNQETQQVEITCETTWTEFINAYKSGLVIELRSITNMYNGEDTYYTPFRFSYVVTTDRLDTSRFSFINLNGIYSDSGNVTGWTWNEIRVKKDTNSTEDAISFEMFTYQATLQ